MRKYTSQITNEDARRANTRAATLSIASNIFIICIEMTAGILVGSMSIIAGAVHSIIDLLAAVIAFFSVRVSAKPADHQHPFGHGKVENISGTVEAILIFLAAIFIIYEAIQKIISGSALSFTELGIAVMLLSMLVNFLVSRHLLRVARKTESLAIEADARHLSADIMTSIGVVVGLLAVRFTRIQLLDPIVAIAIALIIMYTAYTMTKKSFGGLVDERLPVAEEQVITRCITEHTSELIGFHKLRTRKAGAQRHIDLHLVMSKVLSLEEVHKMCDHLEQDIKGKLGNVTVTIHAEPCETECGECTVVCPIGNNKANNTRDK